MTVDPCAFAPCFLLLVIASAKLLKRLRVGLVLSRNERSAPNAQDERPYRGASRTTTVNESLSDRGIGRRCAASARRTASSASKWLDTASSAQDTIKTRAQTAPRGQFSGTIDIAAQTFRKEGILAFYKGML